MAKTFTFFTILYPLLHTDTQIIRSISSGNKKEEAFKALYRQCGPMLRKIAFDMRITEEDAKDILQDAIIVFWQHVINNRYEHRSKISTYIIQICKFKIINKRNRSKQFEELSETQFLQAEPPINREDEEAYTYKEEFLVKCLETLGERCKELVMGLYLGQKMKDLAVKFNYTSTANVTNQRYKCMEQLRSKFKATIPL